MNSRGGDLLEFGTPGVYESIHPKRTVSYFEEEEIARRLLLFIKSNFGACGV